MKLLRKIKIPIGVVIMSIGIVINISEIILFYVKKINELNEIVIMFGIFMLIFGLTIIMVEWVAHNEKIKE